MIETEFMKLYEELEQLNTLEEDNKVVSRFNKPWYSGSFRGLNDISTRQSPKTPEQIEQEKEEREKQEKETRIKNAMLYKPADTYNWRYQQQILSDLDWPALDPETRERVYDPVRKEELVKQSVTNKEQAYQQAQQKSLETRAARQAEKSRTYHWEATYTINNKKYKVGKNVLDNEEPDTTCNLMKRAALKRIKQEKHECTVFKEPFSYDGKIIVTRTSPAGKKTKVAEFTEIL